MKKFISIISVIALILSLAACGKSLQTNVTVTEQSEATEATETVLEIEEESTAEVTTGVLNKKQMNALLADLTTDKIISFVYDDFDKDGLFEAFAFTGVKRDVKDKNAYTATYSGELWYINFSGAKKLVEWGDYWKIGRVFEFKTKKNYSVEKYKATGSVSLIWYVDGSEVKEENISGKVGNIKVNSAEDITAFSTYYSGDKSDTDVGNIRVKYYFYEDEGLKEYGGIKISRKDLFTYEGAKKLVEELEDSGMKIVSMYYRENGIINISIANEDALESVATSITLKLNGKKVSEVSLTDNIGIGSSTSGLYKAALFSNIATYPKKFPIVITTTKPTTTTTTKPTTTTTTTITTTTTTNATATMTEPSESTEAAD